jgi:hypothetical protein
MVIWLNGWSTITPNSSSGCRSLIPVVSSRDHRDEWTATCGLVGMDEVIYGTS